MPEINTMREQAVRRAREMYSRAIPMQNPVNNTENPVEKPTPNIENQTTTENNILSNDFLQDFFKDKERMLILALLVILGQEEGNNSLLFALMYLLI